MTQGPIEGGPQYPPATGVTARRHGAHRENMIGVEGMKQSTSGAKGEQPQHVRIHSDVSTLSLVAAPGAATSLPAR